MPTPREHFTGDEVASFPGAGEAELTLTVAVYPTLDQTVCRTMGLWKQRHPEVAVRVSARPMHDHSRAVAEALANGVNVPDVVGLEMTYMSRFSALGGLEDLSQAPYEAEPFARRMARYALPAARSATGALLALPADIAPGVLFYRKDLLDGAGVAEADLATWDGFLEAGRKLRAATGAALISNVSAIAELRARTGVPPGEGLHFDGDGAPRLRSERFVAAIELARAARAARIDVDLDDEWTPRWQAAVADGHVACLPSGTWMVGLLEDWIAPETRGRWRTTALPGGAHTGWGGSYYALPKRSPNRALGWEWVKLMCLDRRVQLRAFEHTCAFPALTDALDDPFLDEPIPFLGGQRARQQWRTAAAEIPVLPANPLDTLAASALRSALRAVLDHGQDVNQALAEAERRVWHMVKDAI